MNSFLTRFVMYFNKRYERIGPLFQGAYKAVLVESDEQLLHLSRYIHIQAAYRDGTLLARPQPSSYPNYLGIVRQHWISTEEILAYFKSARRISLKDIFSYQSFVEDFAGKEASLNLISSLLLENSEF